MRILELELNQYFTDSSSLIVALDEEEFNNDFADIHVFDKKTLFLKNGYIIKDAAVVSITKALISPLTYKSLGLEKWDVKVKFIFDKLLTEEEYEKLWAVI